MFSGGIKKTLISNELKLYKIIKSFNLVCWFSRKNCYVHKIWAKCYSDAVKLINIKNFVIEVIVCMYVCMYVGIYFYHHEK